MNLGERHEGIRKGVRKRVQKIMLTRINTKLISNTWRGTYIECLVSIALGSEWSLTWKMGDDWCGWDLQHECGARLEVKNAAARMPWDPECKKAQRRPTFDIRPKNGFWHPDGKWIKVDKPCRPADLYVFAWHGETCKKIADHRDASQWQFFVVRETNLPPNQKSISLNPLKKLVNPCSFDDLKREVKRQLPCRYELKATLGPL